MQRIFAFLQELRLFLCNTLTSGVSSWSLRPSAAPGTHPFCKEKGGEEVLLDRCCLMSWGKGGRPDFQDLENVHLRWV